MSSIFKQAIVLLESIFEDQKPEKAFRKSNIKTLVPVYGDGGSTKEICVSLENWKLTSSYSVPRRSAREVLLILAAAGHYALKKKAINIYLSQMQGLQFTHPKLYEVFCKGHQLAKGIDVWRAFRLI